MQRLVRRGGEADAEDLLPLLGSEPCRVLQDHLQRLPLHQHRRIPRVRALVARLRRLPGCTLGSLLAARGSIGARRGVRLGLARFGR